MSDDILLVLALSIGMIVTLTKVMARRLPALLTRRVTALAVGVPLLALLADTVNNLDDPFGHRADYGAMAVLGFMMLVPIWGFFDERLLERIDDLAVATITLALVYRANVPLSLTVALSLGGIGVAVALRRRTDTWWWGLVGYVWFLGCAFVLAIVEFDRVSGPLFDSLDELPSFWLLVASGAAVLYLSFHAWFALKFVLILLSLVRPLGRQYARVFVARSVAVAPMSPLVFWGVLTTLGLVFWLDRAVGLGGDQFVGGLAVFVVPMVHAIVELVMSASKSPAQSRAVAAQP